MLNLKDKDDNKKLAVASYLLPQDNFMDYTIYALTQKQNDLAFFG